MFVRCGGVLPEDGDQAQRAVIRPVQRAVQSAVRGVGV